MANKLENQHPISEHLRELDKKVTSAEATIIKAKERVNNTFGNLFEDNKKRATALIDIIKQLQKDQDNQ